MAGSDAAHVRVVRSASQGAWGVLSGAQNPSLACVKRTHLGPGQGRGPRSNDTSIRRRRVCCRRAGERSAGHSPNAAAAVSRLGHPSKGLRDFSLRQPLACQEGALLFLTAGPHFGVLQEGHRVLDLVLPTQRRGGASGGDSDTSLCGCAHLRELMVAFARRAVCGAATVASHKHLPPPGHIATHLPRARTVAAVPNMLAHAWRTTLFTVKGLTKFMKDGYESHAARFDPRCVARHPRCRVLLPCCVCAGQAGRMGALPQLVARQPLRLHLRAVRRDCRGGVPRAMELTSKSRLCGCTRESCRRCTKAR